MLFGLPIKIEYAAGALRTGTRADGTKWERRMVHPYGHITKTKGLDGDAVDIYVGPDKDSTKVFAIQQMKYPDFKALDEQKFMLGFGSAEDAKKGYLAHYPDPQILGSMKELTLDDFKKKLGTAGADGKKIATSMYVELNLGLLARGEKLAANVAGRPLTKADRAKIKEKNFVFPETRRYPIHDLGHARAALSMVAKHGTPEEKAKVRAAVMAKYPGIHITVPATKEASLSERGQHIADRIDDVGLGVLAAPYAAKGIANTLAHRPGVLGAVGRGARSIADHMHHHENKYELAGLAMVAPGVTHRAAKVVEQKVPAKTASITSSIGGAVSKVKSLFRPSAQAATAMPGSLAKLQQIRQQGQAARGVVGPLQRQIKAQPGNFLMQRPGASAASAVATQGNRTLNAAAKAPATTTTAVPAAGAAGIRGAVPTPLFSGKNMAKATLAGGVGLAGYAGYKAIQTGANLLQRHPEYEAAGSPNFAQGPAVY